MVTYDANGGSFSSSETNIVTYRIKNGVASVREGEMATPEYAGYSFSGWYTDADCADSNLCTDIASLTEDTTLYAKWDVITYTITYDLDGGSISGQTMNYTIETASFALPTPTKEGYIFIGWTGADLTEATTEVMITQGSIGDRSYTANWEEVYAVWDSSANVNIAMKQLAGNADITSQFTADTAITAFKMSESAPADTSACKDVSVSPSNTPIHLWFDNGTIYWWSEDNTPSLKDGYSLFYACENLQSVDLNNLDTTKLSSTTQMFRGCSNLTEVMIPECFDTSNAIDMQLMFYGCSNLTKIVLSESFTTSNVMAMSYMFANCSSLAELVLPECFDTSNVTDMSYMFYGCSALTTLALPDSFDTSNVTNMDTMFGKCSNLTELTLPDSFVTTNVTNTRYMFYGCKSLTELAFLENFNTSKVAKMESMFSGCTGLTKLTLPESFDTSSVTNMSRMFGSCSGLTELTLPDSFDTSNVTNMSYMFYGCSSLTELTLPEAFDTSNVTIMELMFYNCTSLVTIYATDSFTTDAVTSSNYMFSGDTKLVGGSGTTYDGSHIDAEYAHIDEGPDSDTPGYFTDKYRYTITYDLDGGTLENVVTSYRIDTETFTLPTPTKEGYTFIGWTGTDLTEATTEVTITQGSTGNREYTANWAVAVAFAVYSETDDSLIFYKRVPPSVGDTYNGRVVTAVYEDIETIEATSYSDIP